MSSSSDLNRFLKRLDATLLPSAVEGAQSIDMVKKLVDSGLLQAIVPPWDERSASYAGPAWIVRLTRKGVDAARGTESHESQESVSDHQQSGLAPWLRSSRS